MLCLHVYVCIVHTVYENALLLFLEYQTWGLTVLLGVPAKYQLWGPGGGWRGLSGAPGEGPLWGHRGGLQLSSAGTCHVNLSHFFGDPQKRVTRHEGCITWLIVLCLWHIFKFSSHVVFVCWMFYRYLKFFFICWVKNVIQNDSFQLSRVCWVNVDIINCW